MKPTDFKLKKGAGEAPKGNLNLKHVHGLRSHDVRNAVQYCNNGVIVFPASKLAVVQNTINANKQKFFAMHDEEIVCVAVHPDKRTIATGSISRKNDEENPLNFVDIFVWDCESLNCHAHLKGFHRNSIVSMKFSPNGSKLLTFGQDDFNSVAIYDWRN